jgi:hypothetical protein
MNLDCNDLESILCVMLSKSVTDEGFEEVGVGRSNRKGAPGYLNPGTPEERQSLEIS